MTKLRESAQGDLQSYLLMMGNKGRLCLIIVLIADLSAAIVADARGTRVRRHSAEISSSSAPAAPLLGLLSRPDPNQTSATAGAFPASLDLRSEEHTSELQSQSNIVCRLLLE